MWRLIGSNSVTLLPPRLVAGLQMGRKGWRGTAGDYFGVPWTGSGGLGSVGASGAGVEALRRVGRPTSELELAKNRLPDPKCFWPGFPGRYCAKIQILREGEVLGIWCTYGHPPLKSELNAAKTRVSTVPS